MPSGGNAWNPVAMLWGSTGSCVVKLPTGVLIDSLRGSSQKQSASTPDMKAKEPSDGPRSHLLSHPSPKFSSWVPRYCNAENRCTHHAPYQFLIHRIWEHNTVIAVLHPQAWDGLFHGIRQMDISLAPLLSTVDVGGLFRQERIPLRF